LVAAADKVVPIFVDCNWGRANRDITGRYGIRGYPTVVFADPEGKEIERMRGRTPDAIIRQIETVADKHPGGPAWVESVKEGLKAADKAGKPVVILYTDGGEDATATEKAIADKELAELRGKVVLIRHKIDKECEECKARKVEEGGCHVLLLDPKGESLARHKGAMDVEAVAKALESALKEWKKRQEHEY